MSKEGEMNRYMVSFIMEIVLPRKTCIRKTTETSINMSNQILNLTSVSNFNVQ